MIGWLLLGHVLFGGHSSGVHTRGYCDVCGRAILSDEDVWTKENDESFWFCHGCNLKQEAGVLPNEK